MSDSHLREILEPLSDLRQLNPPPDLAMRAIDEARQSLRSRQRRRVIRMTFLACASAAAVFVLIFFIVPKRPQTPASVVAKTPADRLKDAIDASTGFRGLVQVRLEEVQLDTQGEPQIPPQAIEVYFDSIEGTATMRLKSGLRQPTQSVQRVLAQDVAAQPVEERSPAARTFSAKTIPIPLTWQRGTMLIPIAPGSVSIQPAVVTPGQPISISREGNLHRYRVQPAPGGPAQKEANVWIDPATNLVNRVQLLTREGETVKIENLRYQYNISLEQQPPSTRPIGP